VLFALCSGSEDVRFKTFVSIIASSVRDSFLSIPSVAFRTIVYQRVELLEELEGFICLHIKTLLEPLSIDERRYIYEGFLFQLDQEDEEGSRERKLL
jgi:hypothetical protein